MRTKKVKTWSKPKELKKTMWLQIRITPRMSKELDDLAIKYRMDSKSYFVRGFINAITSQDVNEVRRYLNDLEEKLTGQHNLKLGSTIQTYIPRGYLKKK